MGLYRTPEDRFRDLPSFPYEPRYVDVGDARMAYVEAEPTTSSHSGTFVCLHGDPTWSFLYRRMLPVLASRGRVIAPDFVGFGRSDKYDDPDDYRFERFYRQLRTFFERLDLHDVTVVGQDWGGLLGLTLAAHHPDRFARLVAMNTGLIDGSEPMTDDWMAFHEFVETADEIDVGRLVQGGCVSTLPPAVVDAYRAPFPDARSKAGVRAWPSLVPRSPTDPGAERVRAAKRRLAEWDKPAFVLFGDADPITRPYRDALRGLIPTATRQPDTWIENAGHYLQEDRGEAVATAIVRFVDRTSPE